MRSAERGPMPGICRSWAIKSRSAAGYSVFLKTRAGSLGGCFRQVQSERFKPAQVQLQRRIVLCIRAARFLEFRVGLGPAFFSIKHDPVPERVAPGEMLRLGFSRQPKWLVNFMPLLRVYSTEKIDRSRHNCLVRQLEGARADQDVGPVKPLRDTEPARELDRLTAGQESRALAILQWRHNHRAGADAEMHVAVSENFSVILPVRIEKGLNQTECDAHRLVRMLGIAIGKSENGDHAFAISRLNITARF